MNNTLSLAFETDINKVSFSLIDKTLELELITRAKLGDIKARNKLLESQMKQIASMARSYANNLNNISDLFSEGVLGFDYAIDKFDISKGVRFVTYYRFWVRDYINRCVLENHTIRSPMNIAKTNGKTEDELAKLSKSNRRKLEDKMPSGFSMDAPINASESKTTWGDTFCSGECIETNINNKLTIQKVLSGLDTNSREWKMIKYHYINGMTMEDIGSILHITKQSVSIIMQRTFKRIREHYLKEITWTSHQ